MLRRDAAAGYVSCVSPALVLSACHLPPYAQEMPNGDRIRKLLVRRWLHDETSGSLCQGECVSDEISLAEGDSGAKVRGMETATENPAHPSREDLMWLAGPLLELAQERSLEGVLRKAI